MGYINPIFNKQEIVNRTKGTSKASVHKRVRSDKTKSVKFPVTSVSQLKLRTYCKLAARVYRERGIEPISQTKFNNLLLRYCLLHQDIIKWELDYQDTQSYMHTNLLETEYVEIGGPYGLAIRQKLSERRAVYIMIHSVLLWLEKGGGSLEEIL